jgi:hypothetical protein
VKQQITRVKAAQAITLKHVIGHMKSKRLEYVFNTGEVLINDYSTQNTARLVSQMFNIIARYSELTGKELEIFKIQD